MKTVQNYRRKTGTLKKTKAETRKNKWVFSTSTLRYERDEGKEGSEGRDLAGSTYD